jgi:hypothetical protein
MTAINFPAAPATGATHTEAGITWTFDGTVWDSKVADTFVNTTGDVMTGNLTVPSLNGGQLAGFRNILINGNLKINQRGVTIAAAAVGAYGPDRWKKVDATNMTQIIEDVNVVHGAKYTLSWKGGTPQVLTAPATGHWTLPNIPITATEIQLELGEVATPFERRSYGQELVLCQRYCFLWKYPLRDCSFLFRRNANTPLFYGPPINFPVTMRQINSVTYIDSSQWNVQMGGTYPTVRSAMFSSAIKEVTSFHLYFEHTGSTGSWDYTDFRSNSNDETKLPKILVEGEI